MGVSVRLAQGAYETGETCLGMLLASYGLVVGQEELRMVCGVSRDGADLDVLAQAADSYDFITEVIEGEADALLEFLDEQQVPCIVNWGSAHVALVVGRRGNVWEIVDPLTGRASFTRAELRSSLGGRALRITPGPMFRAESRVPGMLGMLTSRASRTRSGVGFVVLAGIALVLPGIAAPAYVRIFVDTYLSRGESGGLRSITIGLTIALIFTVALTLIQLLGLKRLMTATVTIHAAHFMWHLMRMPAWFYSQREPTTLAYRVKLNEQLADVLAGRFTAAMLAQLTSVFYLVVMFIFSPILALISLLGLGMALVMMFRVARVRTEVRQRQAREGSVTATEIGVTLRLLETLKATGNEDVAFARVYSSIGRRITLGNTHLWAWIPMIPVLATFLTAALVLGVGGLLVINGSITQGTLAGFTLLLAGFLAPISILIPSFDSVFNLKGALEQLNDVLDQDVDPSMWDEGVDGPLRPIAYPPVAESSNLIPIPSELAKAPGSVHISNAPPDEGDPFASLATGAGRRRSRLISDPWALGLELRGITFGYGPNSPPLLRDLSLVIAPGHVVAIVGMSGSGKTTLGRLVAGMYPPWSGQVLLNGRALFDYSSAERAREVAFVDQDVVLYQASIRDNITMFDPEITDREVAAAARDALLHDEIIGRPGGYDAKVAEDGRDLSGGQRQRMVIARALVRQPRLLVMDEATSSLDARTEAGVVDRLRGRGCTTLVIAHRLSTVRDADEIIVLDRGQVAERGNHNELARGHGLYRDLMDA